MFSRLQRNIVKNAILFIYFDISLFLKLSGNVLAWHVWSWLYGRVPAKILAGPAIAKRACVHAYLDGR